MARANFLCDGLNDRPYFFKTGVVSGASSELATLAQIDAPQGQGGLKAVSSSIEGACSTQTQHGKTQNWSC